MSTSAGEWKEVAEVAIADLVWFLAGEHKKVPITVKCGLLTLSLCNLAAMELPVGIEHHHAHPQLTRKMVWRLKANQEPKQRSTITETLICNSASSCDQIINPKNQKQKCWFMVKWVVSENSLNHTQVLIKGGHSTMFHVTPEVLHISPAVQRAIIKADGLDYGHGGATTATRVLLQQHK
jgi:hypothetical protein